MEAHDDSIPHSERPLTGKPARKGGSRRRFGRLPQELLQSNLGVVIDISAGGMRVLSRAKPNQRIQITLKGVRLPGPLIAHVTWTRRAGLFMREIGLCFENITPEMSQVLTHIASVHRFRRAM